jgi:Ca2+-transporting ATPase
VAAALTLATGDWTDAGVILLVIVVNTAAGVTQEVKAGQAIAALSEMTAPEARVLRDGEQRTIPAAEVVAGDALVLAGGDIVPADAAVTEAAALLVDESALTGESVPVEKTAGGAAASPGGEQDTVSAGTMVVRGPRRPSASAPLCQEVPVLAEDFRFLEDVGVEAAAGVEDLNADEAL